jgi:HK97 family phage major capsid protein
MAEFTAAEVQKTLTDLNTGLLAYRTEIDRVVKDFAAGDAAVEKRLRESGLEEFPKLREAFKKQVDDLTDLAERVEKMQKGRGRADDGPVNVYGIPDAEFQRLTPAVKELYKHTGSAEYADALDSFYRTPGGYQVAMKEHHPLDLRMNPKLKSTSLTVDYNPGGGVMAQPEFEREISQRVVEDSNFAAYVRKVNIGASSYIGNLRTSNADTILRTSERENLARGGTTQTNRYEQITIPVFSWISEPAVSEELLEDVGYDLTSDVQADVALDYTVLVGQQILSGNGITEPEGIMTNASVLAVNSGAAATFGMDIIRKLPFELKKPYLKRGRYYLSRTALQLLMTLRSDSGAGAGTGEYLWQPSTQLGQPSMLNSFPWEFCPDMDAVGANTFPVMFGDLFEGYRWVVRRGVRILRDDTSQRGSVVFRHTWRYGGKVWRHEAIRKLKCAT